MYYKKLLKRKKLIKFWFFFGSNVISIFKLNYQFLNILYNNNCFLDFKKLLLNIKLFLPLFINIFKLNSNLLFVSTKFFYCQTIYNKFYFSIIKKLVNTKAGIFTNFSVTSLNAFKLLDFYFNPSLIIFFYLKENKFLLLESKKKIIPTIAILPLNINSYFIDYPLFVNSLYFYTIFFFSKFFFKLVLYIK